MKKNIFVIILLGFFIRTIFYLFGAELYYGKSDFHLGGDTFWWVNFIVNLIEHGCYCNDITDSLSCFARTPGYSFFIGVFYILTGKNIDLALKLIPLVQILLDCFCIYFVYSISNKSFKNTKIGLISSLIYSFYPFTIVWNVVVYAESLSIFFFLLSIYLIIISKREYHFVLSGLFMGFAVLTRIQLIVGIPIYILSVLYFLLSNKKYYQKYLMKFLLYCFFLIGTYSVWPLRNYINYDQILYSQHLGDKFHWSPDYMKFMDYIWSIQVDHEPQLTQIISNDSVIFPDDAYFYPGDSTLISEMIFLSRTCGEGFSYFSRSAGYRNNVVSHKNSCNDRLVSIFDTLILHQKEFNSFNYYVKVPLKNLKKAVFKTSLKKASNSTSFYISKILFTYRSILILISLLSLFYLLSNRKLMLNYITILAFSYTLLWYFFQCFFYRNMEIRYLIHADILLIFPFSFIVHAIIKKIRI